MAWHTASLIAAMHRMFEGRGDHVVRERCDRIIHDAGLRRDVWRRSCQVLLAMGLTGALLFLCAGTMRWLFAWLYLGGYLAFILIGALYLPLDVIAERGRRKRNVERWDRVLTGLLFPVSLSILSVAGLDRR